MSNNPKCPVFGCTIPRGIPHEHPAGVSAVMRDPGAPLTGIERAELQYHRHQAAARNQMEFNKMATAAMAISEVEQQMRDIGVHVIRDAPMVPGRKLRDSLIMEAGSDANTWVAGGPCDNARIVGLMSIATARFIREMQQ